MGTKGDSGRLRNTATGLIVGNRKTDLCLSVGTALAFGYGVRLRGSTRFRTPSVSS